MEANRGKAYIFTTQELPTTTECGEITKSMVLAPTSATSSFTKANGNIILGLGMAIISIR